MIISKRGITVIYDSADYTHDRYAEFMEILHK